MPLHGLDRSGVWWGSFSIYHDRPGSLFSLHEANPSEPPNHTTEAKRSWVWNQKTPWLKLPKHLQPRKKKKNNAQRKPAYYRLRWHLNELEQPTCVRKTQHFQLHGTVPSPCRRKLHWVKRGIEVNRQTGSSGGLTDASTLSSRCLNRWNS